MKNTFLGNKRSRSTSKSADSESKHNLSEHLSKYIFNLDSTIKKSCSFCNRDISRLVKIVCSTCDDLLYCLDCLILGKFNKEHYKHDYHIVDELNFSLFTQDWTAEEELNLLTGIEKYGLDNWTDISDFIGTKSKLQCEAHYYNFYYKSLEENIPDRKDFILKKFKEADKDAENINSAKDRDKIRELNLNQGRIPEFNSNKDNKNNRSRSLVKNRNRKDQAAITSASEILGYWPKREEFDIEHLNDAELEIAELEFLENDSPEEIKLKHNVLKVYNAQLEERELRKRFVIERGLLDVKKQMSFEKKLKGDDREIYNCLKPFARFFPSQVEFSEFYEGLVLEKNLRQRLSQLKAYKSQGLKTYDDIEKSLEIENRRKDDKKNILFENCGLGNKINRFLRANTEWCESGEKEKQFIKKIGISKSIYYDIKKRILKEVINEKDSKNISKSLSSKVNMDNDILEEIVDYVITLKESNNI